MPFAWSPAVLDDLHRLFVRERLSAAQTARALGHGLTRHAILGKVQRLGWTRSDAPKAGRPAADNPRRSRRPPPRRRVFGRAIPLPELRVAAVDALPKVWTERGEGECAYPVGEPPAPGLQLSCCAKTARRSAYCPAHSALMRLPGTAMTPDEVQSVLKVAENSR